MSPGRALVPTLLAALAASLPVSTSAGAATAEVVPATAADGSPQLRYAAAPGEVNDVIVAGEEGTGDRPGTVTVADTGAVIAPGPGCRAAGAHAVTCAADYPTLLVALGDGDDRVRSAENLIVTAGPGDDVIDTAAASTGSLPWSYDPAGGYIDSPSLDGGEGDDVVIGGKGAEVLIGGPGRDRLTGGADDDELRDGDGTAPAADVFDGGGGRDAVSYAGRPDGIRVDLRATGAVQGAPGEGDELVGPMDVIGGDGPDVLTGTDAGDELAGGPGDDVLTGGRGDDELRTGPGANRLDGGPGDDTVKSGKPDGGAERITGGKGEDWLEIGPDAANVAAGPDDDYIKAFPGVRDADVRCGGGEDFYVPVLDAKVTRPGPLLRRDCTWIHALDTRPRTVTGSELTFRVHCAEGEMDFATYHCSSVMRLFAGGRVVGRRTFKAVDDQERTLHFPRTSRLDRAIRRNTPIRIELTGFRDVESDFGTDHGGTLVWRITL